MGGREDNGTINEAPERTRWGRHHPGGISLLTTGQLCLEVTHRNSDDEDDDEDDDDNNKEEGGEDGSSNKEQTIY